VSEKKKILSFVKRNGRKLSLNKQDLLQNILPKYEISGEFHNGKLKNVIKANVNCNLEIGYGSGEHIAFQAQNNPQENFIGCEPFLLGTVKLLNNIKQNNLDNIYIYQEDAIKLLAELPNKFLSKIYILFPDPWPKKRHYKRRIINNYNLNLLANKLRDNGMLRIATDHEDYASWIIAKLVNHQKFSWQCNKINSWHEQPKDWCQTKYQKKSLAAGSKNYFFDFNKVK
jgi:tRNA (guanine-N7-)-methyltransferase